MLDLFGSVARAEPTRETTAESAGLLRGAALPFETELRRTSRHRRASAIPPEGHAWRLDEFVAQLVAAGFAEWELGDDGIELRFHTEETFTLAEKVIIRMA